MFKNEFQGGVSLDILTIQAKDLSSKCKILGSSLNGGQRDFDKTIKSYALTLEGESTRTKLVIPKDDKQSLYVLQPYLIIQLCVASGASFSLDVMVADSSNQKRRILLSTSYREVSVTSFHVKIPLTTLKRGMWLNFCLDLKSIVADSFKGNTFKTLESITVCANCKLRRIFTMKLQPKDNFNEDVGFNEADEAFEDIPKSLQFPTATDSNYGTQVLNMAILEAANINFRVGSGVSSRSSTASDSQRLDKSQKTHIAFGSRVAVPKHASRAGSRNAGIERQTSIISLSSSNGHTLNTSQTDFNASTTSVPQVEGQKPVLQPRPPKPGSGKAVRRPNPRIRSAETARLVKRAKLKYESNDVSSSDSTLQHNSDAVQTAPTDDAANNQVSRNDGIPRGKLDENNNIENSSVLQSADSGIRSMSQKLVGMRMGSQEDEDEYFRKRHDSESHDEGSRSKDGSFSSTAESDAFFLYSSRPRSITNNSRGRLNSDSTSKNSNIPEVIIEKSSTTEVNVSASFESDFRRESSDSEGEDPIKKIHKLGGNRRNSPSPVFFDKQTENAKEKIRSSLLKEISPPGQNGYDHLKYQSIQSDTMSWMYDSDSSQLISHDQSFNGRHSPTKIENDKSPRVNRLRIIDGFSVNNELLSDSEDILSDASDETSYSTWKEPPAHIRNYRYQDEMYGVGMTLDLSTTLPMTPYIEEQSPARERRFDDTEDGLPLKDSEKIDRTRSDDKESELDLLYDPVLNCYYDPKTHKYYELAFSTFHHPSEKSCD